MQGSTVVMISLVGNAMMSDVTQKASKSITIDLQRRTTMEGLTLTASKTLNMKRMTDYIVYKAQKEHSVKDHGVNITDLESLEKSFRKTKQYLKGIRKFNEEASIVASEASIVASEALKSYSQSIAVEKIANIALKASKIFNWKFEKNRKWGNIADTEFETGNYKIRKEWDWKADITARIDYTHESFGVHKLDLEKLASYAKKIFKIGFEDGERLASDAIAIESLVNTATKSLYELYAIQNYGSESAEPTDTKLHCEEENDAEQVAHFKFPFEQGHNGKRWCTKTMKIEGESAHKDEYDEEEEFQVGFMNSRNETSIFMDSEEAQKQIAQVSSLSSSSSSSPINWSRIIKFLEFKARKEYAMETYGVKLGDFESLKEAAFKLFEISEAEAAIMASESISDDFESLVVEKIADAAFKSSKILNWVSRTEKYSKTPRGILADARFKSCKSLLSYHKKHDVEAYKAYTMETFGVNLVDIEYLTTYARDTFERSTHGYLNEQEATIMACQTIAVDRLFDATSKALNTTLQNNQLVEPKQVEEDGDRAMLDFKRYYGLDSLAYVSPLSWF